MPRKVPSALAALLFGICCAASAQTSMGFVPLSITNGVLNQMSLDRTLQRTVFSRPRGASADAVPRAAPSEPQAQTRIALGPRRMPALMAQHYAPADRAKAQRTFDQMLTGYAQVARQLGVPVNDVGGAVAAFLAGSWMAYTDIDVQDEDFPVLVAQMRGVLRATPDFMRASAAEKQDLYEQLAILGTTMALTREALKRQPDPQLAARTQQAAHGYLAQFLKVDPARVVIGPQGLSIER